MHAPATQALLAPVHSLCDRQPGAQVLDAVQYSPEGQCACWVHSRQKPELVSQAPLSGQSPSLTHSTHIPAPAAPRQNGVLPPQAAPVGSQTQEWFKQALLPPVHSLSSRQPAVQVFELVQYSPEGQSMSPRHATHVPAPVSQTGVMPPQSPSLVHSTQTPAPAAPRQMSRSPGQTSPSPSGSQTQLPATHALASPPQSPAVRQPGWQVLSAAQKSPPGQSSCCVHSTQMALTLPLAPRQIGSSLGQTPPSLPQTQLPARQRLLSPLHSSSARQPGAQV
jgi:hypothetical protein